MSVTCNFIRLRFHSAPSLRQKHTNRLLCAFKGLTGGLERSSGFTHRPFRLRAVPIADTTLWLDLTTGTSMIDPAALRSVDTARTEQTTTRRWMSYLRLLIAALLFAAGPALAGPYEDGLAAYNRGDYKTAMRAWRPLAQSGNPNAQFSIGAMYDNGQGVPKDDQQAMFWFLKAADQGDAKAQFNLGNIYAKGEDVPKDDQKAVFWYRKAADQGFASAERNLGYRYDTGQGVPKDDQRAVFWYRKAADQGDSKAQFNLGVMYDNGRGVPKDDQQAVFWFRKAADQGDAEAQFNLGGNYERGEGVAKDDQQAVLWYRRAADQGTADAQFNLGLMYAEGRGVPKNDQKAYFWWLLASVGADASSVKNRDIVEKLLTPQQRAAAQADARNWKPTKQ